MLFVSAQSLSCVRLFSTPRTLCSPPGSSLHGILQARILEWVKVTHSCLTLCDPVDYTVHRIPQARILEWVACPLSRGIFPPQGSNTGLPHCRQILYPLSHKGSPRILESIAISYSGGSSWPKDQTQISCGSCIGRWTLCHWASWEAQVVHACMRAKSLQLCPTATLWTVAGQALLSMGFSTQEYWSGLPCSPPRDLPNPGIELTSLTLPALAGGFFTTSTIWEAQAFI